MFADKTSNGPKIGPNGDEKSPRRLSFGLPALPSSLTNIHKKTKKTSPSMRSVIHNPQREAAFPDRRCKKGVAKTGGIVSTPRLFVNPPVCAMTRGKSQSVRNTMGVPMVDAVTALSGGGGGKPRKEDKMNYSVNRDVATAVVSASSMMAAPPSMTMTKGGMATSRRTLGIPMV
ncbi:expressed unknown protein [Seminavis robusta]|uniref:Uncharacterized protein n=1 Tax=Seminavis robusta TaxID=568900 RepID=A0A9N8HKY0_9STRA|nr:expressed unknown protein [Seminavis robusta]|eukprot:Sro982_g227650.1 n/a (174) ;mRNA; f:15533-16054